jgi:hypothetical protein
VSLHSCSQRHCASYFYYCIPKYRPPICSQVGTWQDRIALISSVYAGPPDMPDRGWSPPLAFSAGKVLGPQRLGTAGKVLAVSTLASSTPQSQAFSVSANGKCDDYDELVPLGHVPDDGGSSRGLVNTALGALTVRRSLLLCSPRHPATLPAASQDVEDARRLPFMDCAVSRTCIEESVL